MLKKLTGSGHSRALIIDKSLRRVLGLGPNQWVKISTDGARLIIERAPEPAPALAEVAVETCTSGELSKAMLIDAPMIERQLTNHFGMSDEDYLRLHPTGRRLISYRALVTFRLDHLDPLQTAALRRFDHVYRRLLDNADWEAAVTSALAAFPVEPSLAVADRVA